MNLNLKDHVKDKKKVHFKSYRCGILYYETELGLEFEIPVEETGTGTFNAEEKAINFMKWIRKQISVIEKELNA